VIGDLRKPRAVRDSEILRVYCLRHIPNRLNVRNQYLRGWNDSQIEPL
jgi:hypothetical protein